MSDVGAPLDQDDLWTILVAVYRRDTGRAMRIDIGYDEGEFLECCEKLAEIDMIDADHFVNRDEEGHAWTMHPVLTRAGALKAHNLEQSGWNPYPPPKPSRSRKFAQSPP